MKPILFNTEMVQAILAGRKTETRRLIRRNKHGYLIKPYEEGDVLYVRETWDFLPCITCMERDCTLKPAVYEDAEAITEGCWLYRADGDNPIGWGGHKWRPSIHMPKQAARIFLKVTGIAAEQLCDIDEAGANAEGLYKGWKLNGRGTMAVSARQAFMWLWQSLTYKGPIENNWALSTILRNYLGLLEAPEEEAQG